MYVDIMTLNITLKECALTVITNLAEPKNQTNVIIKNYMHVVFAKTVTLIDTTKYI